MENERTEWMWRISDEDIYLRLAKKNTFMCFCFVLIICRNMSQTSKRAERAEQIWSGWSKFGVGGTNLEWVEQIWSGWSGCGQNSVESS